MVFRRKHPTKTYMFFGAALAAFRARSKRQIRREVIEALTGGGRGAGGLLVLALVLV